MAVDVPVCMTDVQRAWRSLYFFFYVKICSKEFLPGLLPEHVSCFFHSQRTTRDGRPWSGLRFLVKSVAVQGRMESREIRKCSPSAGPVQRNAGKLNRKPKPVSLDACLCIDIRIYRSPALLWGLIRNEWLGI